MSNRFHMGNKQIIKRSTHAKKGWQVKAVRRRNTYTNFNLNRKTKKIRNVSIRAVFVAPDSFCVW